MNVVRNLHKIFDVKKTGIALGLFALCLVTVRMPAMAQHNVDDKLSRLENEIETLSRAVYTGRVAQQQQRQGAPDLYADRGAKSYITGTQDAAGQANSEIRLQQMETEIRDLRGMIEKQGHDMRQIKRQMDVALGDVQVRLNDMNRTAPSYGDAVSGAVAPPQALNTPSENTNDIPSSLQVVRGQSVSKAKVARPLNGQAINVRGATEYEAAFSLLKNDQYIRAAQGFDQFITAYPKHPLIPNAKYWLGESFYVQGQYDKASRIFAEGYQLYPKSPKAADNLLKLGMSLAGLGSTKEACVAYAQVKKEFSTGATPIVRRAEQESARLKCAG